MTTKKQRREITAAKTEARREALRLENLQALERSRDKREQKLWEAERAANQHKAKHQIKAIHETKKAEPIPENILQSVEALPRTESEELLWDIFGKQDA